MTALEKPDKMSRLLALLTALALHQLPAVTALLGPGAPNTTLMTATPLPDGTLLFTGGVQWPGGAASTAAVTFFDPLTGVWTPGPPMQHPRAIHSALKLPGGDVLIAGGHPSSELFRASSRTWVNAGTLSSARFDGQMFRLADGTVLFAGGRLYGNDGQVPDVDAFDASGPGWAPHTALPLPLDRACAIVLEDGGAVLINGADGGADVRHWYRWTGGGFVLGGPLNNARGDMVCVRWNDDQVSILGGYLLGGGYSTAVEDLDLTTGTTQNRPAMPGMAFDDATAQLPSGRVLLHGDNNYLVYARDGGWLMGLDMRSHATGNAAVLPTGRTLLGGSNLTTASIVDERVDLLRAVGDIPLPLEGAEVATLPDGRVLLLGGRASDGGAQSTVLAFDPATDAWSDAGQLAVARYYHSATLLFDGRLLIAGGEIAPDVVTASTELFDPRTGTSSPGPMLARKRSHHPAVRLKDGRVLLLGGFDNGYLTQVELYDPATQTTALAAPLNPARSNFRVARLPDGRVLLACGEAPGGYTDSSRLYELDGGFTALGPLSGVGRAVGTLTLLPGGREVLLAGGFTGSGPIYESWRFDIAARTWRRMADLPQSSATPGVVLRSGEVLLPLGGYSVSTAAYDPLTDGWRFVLQGPIRQDPAIAMLRDGDVLVAGGFDTGAGVQRPTTWRFHEEPALGLPRPAARPVQAAAAPGDTVAFTGTGLLAPSRVGGATTERPRGTRSSSRSRPSAAASTGCSPRSPTRPPLRAPSCPQNLLWGWYWVRPIVHGVSGVSEPLFVGAPAGAPCTFATQCASGACLGTCDGGGATTNDAGPPSDAGVTDGGASDAGPVDGGTSPSPRALSVGCGCGTADVSGVATLLLVACFSRRRRSQPAPMR